jgi:hypothetical protein
MVEASAATSGDQAQPAEVGAGGPADFPSAEVARGVYNDRVIPQGASARAEGGGNPPMHEAPDGSRDGSQLESTSGSRPGHHGDHAAFSIQTPESGSVGDETAGEGAPQGQSFGGSPASLTSDTGASPAEETLQTHPATDASQGPMEQEPHAEDSASFRLEQNPSGEGRGAVKDPNALDQADQERAKAEPSDKKGGRDTGKKKDKKPRGGSLTWEPETKFDKYFRTRTGSGAKQQLIPEYVHARSRLDAFKAWLEKIDQESPLAYNRKVARGR